MNPHTILLIEDDPSDVELTKRALRRSRIVNTLVVVADGQQALDYIWASGAYAGRDSAEPPTLILLDLKLPKISGLEVLRRIRADARTRRLPVVVLTSSHQEQELATSPELGVNSYIRKPVDFQQLAAAVEELELSWLILNDKIPPA